MSPLMVFEQDEAQLHHARAEGVMRGLELARGDGLHDVENHADEAEAVAEHLDADGQADVEQIGRQRGAEHIEHDVRHGHREDQNDHRPLEPQPGGEVAAQDAADQEGRRAVDAADLLGRQAQAALVTRLDQEQRADGLHLALGKAEHHDEENGDPDAGLEQEVGDDLAQRLQHAGGGQIARAVFSVPGSA